MSFMKGLAEQNRPYLGLCWSL